MNCPGCNHPLSGNEDFCPICGIRLIDYQNKKNETKKAKNNAMPVIAIAIAVFILILVIAVVAIFSSSKNIDSDPTITDPENTTFITEPVKTPELTNKPVIEEKEITKKTVSEVELDINNYIASFSATGSVAVSVYDNNTHLQYNSTMADSQFPAWGFYVPIYLAYRTEYGNEVTAYSILSSDPAECNNAANSAMDYFGGPAGITDYISRNYNTSATSYGRKFGQSSKDKDNYTTSREAAHLMNIFYESYNYAALSYNPDAFGVSFPAGAVVYSQLGTENLNAKTFLNVYAVVHGNYSNYSIAVLTRNGAGNNGFIDGLIEFVHNEMEGIGKNV